MCLHGQQYVTPMRRGAPETSIASRGLIALGTYPAVGLKVARDRAGNARDLLTDGIDPSAVKQAEKLARAHRASGTFEVVALEWHAKQGGTWSADYAETELRQLKKHVLPRVRATPFRELTSRDLPDVLRRIEAKRRLGTAHRVRRSLGAMFRYAVVPHWAYVDVSAALEGALAPRRC